MSTISYHREIALILDKASNKLGTLRRFVYASKLKLLIFKLKIILMAADGHNTPARNDPFGQRYLRNEEAVFDYNAWDEVDWPEDKDSEIRKTLNHQRECPVPADLVFELFETPEKQWDDFYRTHNNKFFMDRKWLIREFPELFHQNESGKQIKILEVGCGVGNTTIPLLGANPNLFIYSCDFSKNAIETLKSDYRIDKERCQLFVWDVTKQEGDHQISDCSLDYILCIFVLSAIRPTCLKAALQNLVRLLKPGGMLLVKDYGRHDLTQLRFKSNRLIDENFYQRGDGTLVYFFTLDELDRQFSEIGLKQRQCFMDKRLVVNRAKKIKMYRRWVQCKYIKENEEVDGPES